MNENLRDFDQPQESSFNYQEFLFKCYHYWYLFVISIVVAVAVSFFFNKYARPEYEVKSTILIKDRSENKMNPQEMLGIGMFNGIQNLQNEMEIISSYNITSYPQPVNMTLNLTFLSPTQFKLEADAVEVPFYTFSEKKFVRNRKENVLVNGVFSFQQVIQRKDFRFKVVLTDDFDEKKDYQKSFSFKFRDYDGLVAEFRTFTVEPVKKDASVVVVTMKSIMAYKGADFIDALTSEYVASGLEKKNIAATRTINFIDSELMGISDSLNVSERILMNFRTNKEIMNLDAQSQAVFSLMMELQDQKAVLMVKDSFLKKMKKYIEANQDLQEMIMPASLGIDNSALNSLTQQLTALYMKRSESSLYSKDKSPTTTCFSARSGKPSSSPPTWWGRARPLFR